MMILNYATKKELTAKIGQPLDYTETSMFGEEFKADGSFPGCNRPSINPRAGEGWREFFARVTMTAGRIEKVE